MNTMSVTTAQLKKLEAEAIVILRTAKQFSGCTDAQIKEHVLTPGYAKKNWIADSWLNCIVSSFAVNVSIPPSQESAAWDSFEGGHTLWDERSSIKTASDLASKLRISLK